MTAAPTAPAAIARSAKSAALAAFVSVLSHLVVLPIAAWNHNLFLVIVAALAPMAFLKFLRATGRLPKARLGGRRWVKSLSVLAITASVFTVVLWNHLWVLALVLAVVLFIARTKVTVRAR